MKKADNVCYARPGLVHLDGGCQCFFGGPAPSYQASEQVKTLLANMQQGHKGHRRGRGILRALGARNG